MKKFIRSWLFEDHRNDTAKMLNRLFDLAVEGNLTAIRLILEHSKPDKEPR